MRRSSLSFLPALVAAAIAASTTTAVAAGPPEAACTATAATRACDLWAAGGTVDLTGHPGLRVWTFTDSAPGGSPSVSRLGGPTIVATEGERVEIALHNTLSEPVSLGIPGEPLAPDMTGAPPGATATYGFTASRPGTYLYEAGPTDDVHRQVAMGLYGALIVRPSGAPGTAYGSAATAFDDEATLVLSEVDPALNADPAHFDMAGFTPSLRLINGRPAPDVPDIATDAGHRVLLRYVNAGVEEHPMGLLGLRQSFVAEDGRALRHALPAVSETIAPGATRDALVNVPAVAPTGVAYPLLETSLRTDGGMLTALRVPGTLDACHGPVASRVQAQPGVTPVPTAGGTGVSLTATMTACATGANVTGAEYFIDMPGLDGTGTAIDVASPSGAVDLSATISDGTLSDLLAASGGGTHTIYVHARDSRGDWGPVGADTLVLDTSGPETRGIDVSPALSGGNADIEIHATAADGVDGQAITAAELWTDGGPGSPGTGVPLTASPAGGTDHAAALSGTVTAPAGGFPEGTHTVTIRARDALGLWGDPASATFTVDRTSPVASAVTVTPSPNNGKQPFEPNHLRIKVTATLTDPPGSNGPASKLDRAEGFVDLARADGTGFLFAPADGQFDAPAEAVYAYIPLSGLSALSDGAHAILVHGRDAAGNWGATASGTLVIDRSAPAVAPLSAAFGTPAAGGARAAAAGVARVPTVTLATSARDGANGRAPASAIAGAEWFSGSDPGAGSATPLRAADGAFDSPKEAVRGAVDVRRWLPGRHRVSVRFRDTAGNWSAPVTRTVNVRFPVVSADGFESGALRGFAQVHGDWAVSASRAARLRGRFGLHVALRPGGAWVRDDRPRGATSLHAAFRFAADDTGSTGRGHDVLVGADPRGHTLLSVQARRTAGDEEQMRVVARTATGTQASAWHDLPGAAGTVRLVWVGGDHGSLDLYLGDRRAAALDELATAGQAVGSLRLGAAQVPRGVRGSESFDDYVVAR